MLVIEFVFISIAAILGLVASALAIRQQRKSPIIEMKVLAGAITFQAIAIWFIMPLVIFSSSSDGVDSLGLFIYKMTSIPIALSLLAWKLTFILPKFKASYRSLLLFATTVLME
ncbi:MAG: hypothetical protein ACE5OZ_18645 [Candidatus Heimdallarchaeota archaeon]